MGQPFHVRLATEAALLGGLLESDINPNLIILSDDAGQFNILMHALCWIHAERLIKKLEPISDVFAQELEQARSEIWALYNELKLYKEDPTSEKKETLKQELLLVLERPEIPLHNNRSETDARDRVMRRKLSGTFKDESRRCWDTFASLKRTCRKLGYTFWSYLDDRLSLRNEIPDLGYILRARLASTA